MKTIRDTESTVCTTLETLPTELLTSLLLSSWEETIECALVRVDAFMHYASVWGMDRMVETIKEAYWPRSSEDGVLHRWRPWSIFLVSHHFLDSLTKTRALLIIVMHIFGFHSVTLDADASFYRPHLIEPRLFFRPLERHSCP